MYLLGDNCWIYRPTSTDDRCIVHAHCFAHFDGESNWDGLSAIPPCGSTNAPTIRDDTVSIVITMMMKITNSCRTIIVCDTNAAINTKWCLPVNKGKDRFEREHTQTPTINAELASWKSRYCKSMTTTRPSPPCSGLTKLLLPPPAYAQFKKNINSHKWLCSSLSKSPNDYRQQFIYYYNENVRISIIT